MARCNGAVVIHVRHQPGELPGVCGDGKCPWPPVHGRAEPISHRAVIGFQCIGQGAANVLSMHASVLSRVVRQWLGDPFKHFDRLD